MTDIAQDKMAGFASKAKETINQSKENPSGVLDKAGNIADTIADMAHRKAADMSQQA